MIRVNLLPVRELNAESNRRKELAIAGVSLATTAVILVALYLSQTAQLSNLSQELPAIRKEIEILNGRIKELGNLEAKIKELSSKHKVIEDLRAQKVGPVRFLDTLAGAIPSSLWLVEIKQSGESLIINGLATDNQSVAEFMRSLSRSAHFKNVELVETNQTDEKTGAFKKFSIQSGISYQSQTSPERSSSAKQSVPREGNS